MQEPLRIADPASDAAADLRSLLADAPGPNGIEAAAFERGLAHATGLAAVPVAAAGTWLGFKGAAWAKAAVAVSGGAAVTAVLVVSTPQTPPGPTEQPTRQTVAAPPRPAAPKAIATPNAEPEPYAEQADDGQTAGVPTVEPRRARPRVKPEEALALEARLLERARAVLEQRPARALDFLREHRRQFPRGQLRAEHEMIAVEALVRLGRRDEARARAERALARFPGGLYAQRMRRVLDR